MQESVWERRRRLDRIFGDDLPSECGSFFKVLGSHKVTARQKQIEEIGLAKFTCMNVRSEPRSKEKLRDALALETR